MRLARIVAGGLIALVVGGLPAGAAVGKGFGNGGYLFGFGTADAIAPLPNGDIILAYNDYERIQLWRVTSEGAYAGHLPLSSGFPCRRQTCHANLAVDAAGRILVSGGGTIARLLPSGVRDRSFGTAGLATVPGIESSAMAVSASGAVALAGPVLRRGYPSDSEARLARILPSGLLDPSFGIRGISAATFRLPYYRAIQLAIQRDEKIIVGTVDAVVAVARYGTDGRLDPSYGKAGIAATAGVDASALALQSDGKLVVGGLLRRPGERYGAAVLRLREDGNPDLDFGVGGISPGWKPIHAADLIRGLVVQPGGQIVVTGESQYYKQTSWFVHRVSTAGTSLGPSVGGAGYPEPERDCWGDSAWSIAADPDGRILVGGGTCDASVLARYLPDLRLDADGARLRLKRMPGSTPPVPIRATGRQRVAIARVAIDYPGTLTATVRRAAGGKPLALLPGTSAGGTTLRSRAHEASVSLPRAGAVTFRLLLPPDALAPNASYVLTVRAIDTRSRRAALSIALRAQ